MTTRQTKEHLEKACSITNLSREDFKHVERIDYKSDGERFTLKITVKPG